MTQTIPLPEPTPETLPGTRVAATIRVGYQLNVSPGRLEQRPGTYSQTVYWADNSVEGFILLDEPIDGGTSVHTIVYSGPSGDIC